MSSVKSLEWNPRVDPLGKGEFFDNTNTFFGFQVPAGFLGGRLRSWLWSCGADSGRAYLSPLAVTNQDDLGRVTRSTKIILIFVVSACRMKTILIQRLYNSLFPGLLSTCNTEKL